MILVTGACGNVGRYIVRKLLDNGQDVVACDIQNKHTKPVAKRLAAYANSKNRQLIMRWTDLSKKTDNEHDFEAIFKANQITGVIHLAFIITPWTEIKPEYSYQVNVGGTRRLVDLTVKYAPSAPFVFASSATVFGPPVNEEIYFDETHATQATSNYTQHKLECEQILKDSPLAWRILRFSAVMNPIYEPDRESMDFGKEIGLKVHLEPVHVEDVATALYHALTRDKAARKIFIISGGKKNQMTYKEYIFRSLSAIAEDMKESDIPWEKFAENNQFLQWYDTTESQAILTYQSRSMDDYIRDMRAAMPWWKKLAVKILGKKVILDHFFRGK